MSMSIRIRTPNSAETYQFELPSHLRTLGDLRAVLHHDAQRAASTSSLSNASTTSLIAFAQMQGSVLHLIPRGRLGISSSDSNLAHSSSHSSSHTSSTSVRSTGPPALQRSNTTDSTTSATTSSSTASGSVPASPSITMSVNGVQFAVPSGTTVGVRVPVHAVPLHAEQRTVVPTLMRTTPHTGGNSSSGTITQHHHQQQTPGTDAQAPHSQQTFSPTSRRETVANAPANPAVQLSANLLGAVRASNLAEMRELLAQGASAALLHGAVSAFHVAALQPDPAVMELLLQSPGVNTELKNRNGETALHYASYHRNAPIQRILLQHGANVHARTTGGDSALHLAASVGAVGDVIEQLVTAMSQCPLQPRSVCSQRVALTIGLHDSFGRSVLARAVVNGTTRTVEQLLALMPKSGCSCTCAMCASSECAVVARATWRQTLLAVDSFARVCDANLLLSAARHGNAADGVFAAVIKAWWRSACETLSHDAARALLARYLTMLTREQSVCSLLQLDTDAIHEQFLAAPALTPTSTTSTTTTSTTGSTTT